LTPEIAPGITAEKTVTHWLGFHPNGIKIQIDFVEEQIRELLRR
jgi:hypothetical protein